jgi:hypothetical protein
MFRGGVDERSILGDATDCGLLRYCDRIAPSSLVRLAYKKVRRVRVGPGGESGWRCVSRVARAGF